MNKLIILGAGFSAPAGIPAMRGFFKRLQDLVNNPTSGLGGHSDSRSPIKIDDRGLARDVLNEWMRWKARTPAGCDDLEAFCQSIEPTSDLRWNTSYVTGRTFQLCMEQGPCRTTWDTWEPFYRRFARDLTSIDRVTVVSFNYDLLLDQALLQVGVRPDYCLTGPEVIDDQDDHKPRRPCPEIRLLKPHGSLNWLVCREPSCKVVSILTPPTPDSIPQNWPSGPERHHLDRHSLGEKDYLRFLMLPPTSAKAEDPSYENERTLLKSVDETMTTALGEAEEVYFLGYSIPPTDAEILARLQRDLRKCCHAVIVNRVTAVDDVRDLIDRYQQVSGGRFPLTFFLGNRLGNVLEYRDSGCAWRDMLLGRRPGR